MTMNQRGLMFTTASAQYRSTRSSPPRTVRIAFAGMIAAVMSGVVEAACHVASTVSETGLASVAGGLAVRAVIYAVVLMVSYRMLRGDRWARALLAVGIGVVGLASLIMEPLSALLAGDAGSLSTQDPVVVVARFVHIAAVLVAVPAMFTPSARPWFRR